MYNVCNNYANNILDPAGDAPVNTGLHKCGFCDHAFSTKQQLAVHVFVKHGVKRAIRQKVDTLSCASCLQFFHTRGRIIAHIVEKSSRCRIYYNQCLPTLDENVVELLDQQFTQQAATFKKKGLRRHHAELPAVRTLGPLTVQAELYGVSHRLHLSGPLVPLS